MHDVPAEFEPIERPSAFLALIGPVYERHAKGRYALGLRIEDKHANRRGICHGGVLATIADVALGRAVRLESGARSALVTASLTIDYAGRAHVGDWIESAVDVQRVGARLAFANCILIRNAERIVRASAIFAVSPLKSPQ